MSDAQAAIIADLRKQIEALQFTHSPTATTTTGDSPPKYDDANAVVLKAFREKLESQDTRNQLKAEIERLGTAAQDVEIAFRNVSRGLAQIVTAATDRGQIPKKIKKLRWHKSNWDRLREKYVELLWDSRRVAGNARAIATDFAGAFLNVIKNEQYSIEEKREEIAAYREELEKDKKNAQKLSDGFKDLHNDVVEFREDLKNELKAWSEEATQRINKLLDDIAVVETEVEKAKNRAIYLVVGGIGLGVAGGIVTAIGIVCPILWIGSVGLLVGAVAMGIHARRQYLQVVEKREHMIKQLDEDIKEATGAAEISARVGSLESHMGIIEEKLEIFAKVWSIAQSDLDWLDEELKLASSSKGKLLFRERIDTISTAYRTLALALRLYETNVHFKHSK